MNQDVTQIPSGQWVTNAYLFSLSRNLYLDLPGTVKKNICRKGNAKKYCNVIGNWQVLKSEAFLVLSAE